MRQALQRRLHPESGEPADGGAVLLLVLGFLLITSVMSGAMLSAVDNNLTNSQSFVNSRGVQYDAASATNLAIQAIRYKPLLSPSQTLNASPPASCAPGGSTYTGANGNPITVWCSTRWNPTSASTRVVTFSACPSTLSAAACAASPVLQAMVTFDDYPPGLSTPSSNQCVVYCGAALSLTSWISYPTVPTVSGIGTSSGPATGGTSVSVSGSGFVSGSTTVNFVEEVDGTPTNHNIVLPGASVNFGSSNSLSVTTPSTISGSTYFVTVTTPSGTSAYGPVFTFNPVTPTVTGLSAPAQGTTAGGATLTINGTGFRTGASVNLVPSGGGSGSGATHVVVASASQITVVTPSVTSAGTYYVQVTTSAGSSATGSNSQFIYSTVVPTANTLDISTGSSSGGTSVTITGSGFVGASTVAFTLINKDGITASNTTVAGVNVTVNSGSSITVTTPSVKTAGYYFVTVTNPGNCGTANNPAACVSSYFPEFQFT